MILYIGFLIFVLFILFSWVWCCTSQLPFATIAAPSQWQIKKKERKKKKPPIFWAKLCCVWISVLLPLRSNPLGRTPAPPAPSPSPDPIPWDKGQRWAGISSPWQSQHSQEGGGGTRRPVDQGMESSMSGKRNQHASQASSCPISPPAGRAGQRVQPAPGASRAYGQSRIRSCTLQRGKPSAQSRSPRAAQPTSQAWKSRYFNKPVLFRQ